MSTHTVTLSTEDTERIIRALVGHADTARTACKPHDIARVHYDALVAEADAATVLAERLATATDPTHTTWCEGCDTTTDGNACRVYDARHGTDPDPEPAHPFVTDDTGRLVVVAANGTRFAVRVLHRGDTYGATGALVNDHDTPLVEFYDLDQVATHGRTGQFVSRYYAHTLLGTGPHAGERIGTTAGIDLHGGVPAWSVDRVTAAHVADWLDTVV